MKNYHKIIRLYIPALVLLLVVNSFTSYTKIPNYSGTWVINLQKSKFGDISKDAAIQRYKIEQRGAEMVLAMTGVSEDSDTITSVQKVSINGASSIAISGSKRTRKISAVYSEQQNVLIITMSYYKQGSSEEIDYVLTQTWKMADDGKELVGNLTSPGYSIALVYDKLAI